MSAIPGEPLAVAIVGGGVMGRAFTEGLIASGLSAPDRIMVVEPETAKRAALSAQLGVTCVESPQAALAGARVVLLAVKPQAFTLAATQLLDCLPSDSLVISIMAGIPVARLVEETGHDRVVRAMPNAAARLRESATVWFATASVASEQRDLASSVLSAVGLAFEVNDESLLDAATAVSGSGPAYFCLLAEGMIEGAVAAGFGREMAQRLVVQTITGTASLLSQTGAHPALVRESITSPAGTTAAGLLALEARGMRAGAIEAILAAYHRAKQLGGSTR